MGDIFREIDEELRQERFDKLWRRYGKYVIAAAVAVVIAVAGFNGWKQYQTSRRIEDGARFASAKVLLDEGKNEEARALFGALARESGTNYGVLARFHAAALKADSGDAAGAATDFDAIAADSGADRPLRDLAIILSALATLNSTGSDAVAIVQRLDPLAGAASPWRHSALEIMALAAQKSGDIKRAREYYKRIVDDVDAPQGVRGRASQMLAIIGN